MFKKISFNHKSIIYFIPLILFIHFTLEPKIKNHSADIETFFAKVIPENIPSNDDIELKRENFYKLFRESDFTPNLRDSYGDIVTYPIGWNMTKDRLIYVYNAKAASSTLRTIIDNTHWERGIYVDLPYFFSVDNIFNNQKDFEIFSVIQDPIERLISAYSTVLSLNGGNGEIGKCGTKIFNPPPLPKEMNEIERNSNNGEDSESFLQSWRDHFSLSIDMWVDYIESVGGFGNPSCEWNEHIAPQIKYFMGFDISFLGCVNDLEKMQTRMKLFYSPSLEEIKKYNVFEDNVLMPRQEFQSIDLISTVTKEKLLKLYSQDVSLYRTFCKSN